MFCLVSSSCSSKFRISKSAEIILETRYDRKDFSPDHAIILTGLFLSFIGVFGGDNAIPAMIGQEKIMALRPRLLHSLRLSRASFISSSRYVFDTYGTRRPDSTRSMESARS